MGAGGPEPSQLPGISACIQHGAHHPESRPGRSSAAGQPWPACKRAQAAKRAWDPMTRPCPSSQERSKPSHCCPCCRDVHDPLPLPPPRPCSPLLERQKLVDAQGVGVGEPCKADGVVGRGHHVPQRVGAPVVCGEPGGHGSRYGRWARRAARGRAREGAAVHTGAQ